MSASGDEADAAARQAPPFFVVGAQRSGTTLLRLMLDHHPRIAVPHEFDFAVALVGDDGRWPELPRYYAFLEEHGSFRRSGFRVDRSLDYGALVEDFLRQRQGDKPLVGMALHEHFDRVLHLWPQARFVHLLRDPRDVALSVIGRGWAGNVWVGVERWLEAERSWDRLTERVPPERRTQLRYEDLVREPATQLERVCRFLGVEYADPMLDYARDTTYAAPDPAVAERWRRRLSEREVALVEGRLGDLLTRRGYAPAAVAAARPGRLGRAWLRLDSRVRRVRQRVRGIGLPLVLADFLARRLHWAGLRERTRMRIRSIAEREIQ